DLADGGPVLIARRVDEVEVLGRREEALADGRVLEDEQEVRGVSPDLVGGGARDLVAQLAPGRDAVAPRPIGVRGAEVRRHDLADGVVQDEPVAAELDEWQAPDTL